MPDQIHLSAPKLTHVKYRWPSSTTGIERVMLSAEGNLQHLLSAYFDGPISVQVIYLFNTLDELSGSKRVSLTMSNPSAVASAVSKASPNQPIIQQRQIVLTFEGKAVCTATSTVRIKSPRAAHLSLERHFAIGQLFRELGELPRFELLDAGIGSTYSYPEHHFSEDGRPTKNTSTAIESEELWRSYRLSVPEFETDILEVFPNRQMFREGAEWLKSQPKWEIEFCHGE